MEASEKETKLIEKLKLKDAAAFSAIYALYIRKIYAYALGIVKSPELAEDIMQETFVKLWEQSPFLQSGPSLQPYLFTIARNQCLNLIKRASRETWISDEILAHAMHQSENGLQYTQRRQTGEFIQHAIDQLPPKRRHIYELCRNYGYSYKQAAEKLGISDATVNSQMVKAIKTIKDFLIRNGALILIYFFFG